MKAANVESLKRYQPLQLRRSGFYRSIGAEAVSIAISEAALTAIVVLKRFLSLDLSGCADAASTVFFSEKIPLEI